MKTEKRISALLVLWFSVTAAPLAAQVCRLSIGALNQSRKVLGPVNTECGGDPHYCPFWIWPEHSIPYGNWGVTSNFGQKQDGHQFQGWCHNSFVCDNYGNCGYQCEDGWWEWNSCTSNSQFSAPNCYIYNYNGCTQQATTTGIDVYGGYYIDLSTSCPYDWNGDGACDSGGCLNMSSYSSGTAWMTLYELDGCDEDELVQSLYFPSLTAYLTCDVSGCYAAGSSWVTPNFYDTPSWPPLVDAQVAMAVNWGAYVDTNGYCAYLAQQDPRYNCY